MTHFDTQPRLTGEHIELRPLTAADWPALFAVASDPLIWAGHPAHDRWQEAVFRRFFDEAMASGGALAIVDAGTGAIIGSSRFDFDRADAGEVEIGWTFLARAQWGGTVNRTVKQLMVAHAFRYVERVIFLVGDTNLRSQHALAKIGARLTDRRQAAAMAGKPVVHLIYAIERADFLAAG